MLASTMTKSSLAEERIQVKKLVEVVVSRSTRTPVLLRLQAAQRLMEAQSCLSDFLEVLALSEFEPEWVDTGTQCGILRLRVE